MEVFRVGCLLVVCCVAVRDWFGLSIVGCWLRLVSGCGCDLGLVIVSSWWFEFVCWCGGLHVIGCVW